MFSCCHGPSGQISNTVLSEGTTKFTAGLQASHCAEVIKIRGSGVMEHTKHSCYTKTYSILVGCGDASTEQQTDSECRGNGQIYLYELHLKKKKGSTVQQIKSK